MTITAKTFKTKLSAFVSSQKTQRDKLQALIMFGLNHAAENNGEFTYLSQIMAQTVPLKSVPTAKIKEYVKGHVTNVSYAKNKDGVFMFMKTKKGEPCVFTAPQQTWYDFSTDGDVKPDVHPMQQLKAWATRAKKALEGDKVKDDDERAKTEAAIAEIAKLLA